MSSPEELRNRAEAARKGKNYTQAADLYSDLLAEVYSDDKDLSVQVCKDLVHYGECLLNTGENDEDTFETIWEVLENARVGYEKMKEEDRPAEGLIDVHELLGELSLKRLDLEEAVSQYQQSSELALANPNLSWRIPLNSLFMKATALNYLGKLPEYRDALDKAINFIDEEKAKPKNAADIKAMDEIRADFVNRRENIRP
ncbi:hypothetical protein M9Y10_000026 [Tritrichomonas musculus]|uniref:Tetratricopeptide repeat protein n=1 Tax=Tritrichomonas musculus TaxID=1915356 RepID=A0ABR2L432_9EUKA